MHHGKTIVTAVGLLALSAFTVGLCVSPRQAVAVQIDERDIAPLARRVAVLEAEVAEMRKVLLRAGGGPDIASDVKHIRTVAKLRIADLQLAARNLHDILRTVSAGKLEGQALRVKNTEVSGGLTSLWIMTASYGLGRDPYLDAIRLTEGGFSRGTLPPDFGVPGSYVSFGFPRLHESYLEASGTDSKTAEAKKTEFKKLVEAYSNPAVFPHRGFSERTLNEYSFGKNLSTPQHSADLQAAERWVTDLEGVLEKLPAYFDKTP